MKKVLNALRGVLADLAKLQNKALATSIVAFLVAVVSPLGIDLGPNGGKILAVLAAIGGVAALVEKFLKSA